MTLRLSITHLRLNYNLYLVCLSNLSLTMSIILFDTTALPDENQFQLLIQFLPKPNQILQIFLILIKHKIHMNTKSAIFCK